MALRIRKVAIAGLTLTSETPGTLTATWDAPTPTPTGYDVLLVGISSASITATSHTFTDLEQGSLRSVQVRARYDERTGPWSDPASLRVAWKVEDVPWLYTAAWPQRIHDRQFGKGRSAVSYARPDGNPETLDLTLRADVVDAGGRDFDSCEGQGMGQDHNLYIIDEHPEVFDVYFGSSDGSCFAGTYTIIATLRNGSGKILRRSLTRFIVEGGPVACVGCGLLSMPTIAGDPIVGETLTADISGVSIPTDWRDVQVSYQWITHDGNDETEISGATQGTYAVAQSDLGKLIKVRIDISYTDEQWDSTPDGRLINVGDATFSDHVKSLPSKVVVARPNNAATGSPTISGTAQVSETLTASASGIADADGLTNVSFSYQWIANDGTNDSDIQDAIGSTYALVAADQGNTIKVRVAFTDDNGNEETLTSAATVAVAARPNTAATSALTITGTAQVGETLTASTSEIADADGLTNVSYSYQWISNDGTNDSDIQDATGSTYTLVVADQGNTIKVKVSFTDDNGNEETLTSVATSAVAAAPLTATIHDAPSSHDGSAAFTFELRFSETPADGFSYRTLRDHAFAVTNGDVTGARRLEAGKNIRWEITVQPSGSGDMTITLPATTDCAADGAICTDGGRMLSESVEFTVSGPEVEDNEEQNEQQVTPLTASVHNVPSSHEGSSSFTFDLHFTQTPKDGFSYKTLRDHAFTVAGGEVTNARRLEAGKNLKWEITVDPSTNGDVTVVLPVTTDCTADGAICTTGGKMLSERVQFTVLGPSS